MKTHVECILCFLRQAYAAAKIAGAGVRTQKRIIADLSRVLTSSPLTVSPPEIGRVSYGLVKKITHCADPYKRIKEKSNRSALGIYRKLKRMVSTSPDRLRTAVDLAIAGNILDFGVNHKLDISHELEKILLMRRKKTLKKTFFHYGKFQARLKKSNTVLYLADNAGETVFDRILIEEIKRIFPRTQILYGVKEKPIINDALIKDAVDCGIQKNAGIISSGSDASGTLPRLCSAEFKKIYVNADMIISKGQGNFESLCGQKRPIFFLFKVKCHLVADQTGCEIGQTVLWFKGKGNGAFKSQGISR